MATANQPTHKHSIHYYIILGLFLFAAWVGVSLFLVYICNSGLDGFFIDTPMQMGLDVGLFAAVLFLPLYTALIENPLALRGSLKWSGRYQIPLVLLVAPIIVCLLFAKIVYPGVRTVAIYSLGKTAKAYYVDSFFTSDKVYMNGVSGSIHANSEVGFPTEPNNGLHNFVANYVIPAKSISQDDTYILINYPAAKSLAEQQAQQKNVAQVINVKYVPWATFWAKRVQ